MNTIDDHIQDAKRHGLKFKSTPFDPNNKCKQQKIYEKFINFCRCIFNTYITSDQVRSIVGSGCSDDILKKNLHVFYDNNCFDIG